MARSRHPGVKLFTRRRRHGVTHYGRVQQLDGTWKDTNLDDEGLRGEVERFAWALRQSALQRAKRRERALGLRPPGSDPREAGARFLRDAAARLRRNTVRNYTLDTERLVAWLESRTVTSLEELDQPTLFGYREHLVALGLAPTTLSSALKNTQTALGWWRCAGLLPRLTQDTIRDMLRPPPVASGDPVVYAPAQLRALLEAALPRWEDAVPVALDMLLGLRLEELVQLAWARVDPGEPPQAVRLLPQDTKTKRARTVDLSISPGAARILQGLRERALRDRPGAQRALPWLRTQSVAKWIMRRLRRAPGVPADVTWKGLRSTCGTFLACSGVWGPGAHLKTARQMGHSLSVSDRYYLGLVRVDPTAQTLEEAMGVADLVDAIAVAVKPERATG